MIGNFDVKAYVIQEHMYIYRGPLTVCLQEDWKCVDSYYLPGHTDLIIIKHGY